MLINSPNISGSLTVTGNAVITGSLTVAGGINATITGSATSASYVEYSNVANKPALVSGSSQVTYSGLTGVPSGIVSGSSQITYSGLSSIPSGIVSGSSQVTYSGLTGVPNGIVSSSAQITGYSIFATTGSNQFNGSQAVTGSLTVTGQVVAQTLNVQQVTSSIVYSSGSNIFGNSLGNTQQFTGSVSVTGSLTVTTTGTELQVTSTGVNLGNALTDSHIISGSLTVNPNGLFVSGSGIVGIGTTSPLSKFHINTGTNQNFRVRPGTDVGATNGVALNSRTDDDGSLQQLTLRASDVIMLASGNVGINTASPNYPVEVRKATGLWSTSDDSFGSVLGVYFNTANTGGTQNRFRILADQNAIYLDGYDAFPLVFRNNGNTERMSITSGGNVFINNSSGVTLNDLTNRLSVSSTTYNLFDISRFSDNAFGPNFYLVKSRNGSIGGNTIVANGDNLGNINWLGANGTGFTDAASIKAEVDGAPGASDMPGRLVFSTTADGATSVTERMRITSAGNVGINTTSPGAKLQVEGGELRVTTSNAGVSLYNTAGSGEVAAYNWGGSAYIPLNLVGLDLKFNTSTTERMRITSGGNVGIGTSTPGYKIDVLGASGNISSDMVNGTIINIDGGSITSTNFGVGIAFVRTGSQMAYIKAARENATDEAAYLAFATQTGAGVHPERMRITSGGYLKASNTGYVSSTGLFHEFNNSTNDNETISIRHTGSAPYGILISYTGASPNNTSKWFAYFQDSTALRFEVRSNGGISNYQANDTNLSDERTKKDIAPLESYWDKFKAIEIVKFKYKDQTHDDYNIGVIAQQVEAVAPEFVDVDGWGVKPELDEEGNTIVSEEEPLKSIYTADLHHATIKVLQEAMAKIESLEAILQRNNIS